MQLARARPEYIDRQVGGDRPPQGPAPTLGLACPSERVSPPGRWHTSLWVFLFTEASPGVGELPERRDRLSDVTLARTERRTVGSEDMEGHRRMQVQTYTRETSSEGDAARGRRRARRGDRAGGPEYARVLTTQTCPSGNDADHAFSDQGSGAHAARSVRLSPCP